MFEESQPIQSNNREGLFYMFCWPCNYFIL